MSDPDDASAVTRLRRSLRAGAEAVASTASAVAERRDLAGTIARVGRTGGAKLKQAGAALGATVNRGVGRAAGNLTLGEYRDEVDRALAEAAEVIAAQAAHIAELEARLAAIERTERPADRDG